MANLFGWIKDEHKSNAKRQTRTSSTDLASQLETWTGAIRTELHRDGSFTVYIGPKGSPRQVIATGNVNNIERHVTLADVKGLPVYAPDHSELNELLHDAATVGL